MITEPSNGPSVPHNPALRAALTIATVSRLRPPASNPKTDPGASMPYRVRGFIPISNHPASQETWLLAGQLMRLVLFGVGHSVEDLEDLYVRGRIGGVAEV